MFCFCNCFKKTNGQTLVCCLEKAGMGWGFFVSKLVSLKALKAFRRSETSIKCESNSSNYYILRKNYYILRKKLLHLDFNVIIS